jgi:hypothetical protein
MLWTGAIAAVGVWGAYNDVRAGRLENERNEARATVETLERNLAEVQESQTRLSEMVRDADAQSRASAEAVAAERARRTRTERELQRIRNANQEATQGGRIDYGIPSDSSMRDAGSPSQ